MQTISRLDGFARFASTPSGLGILIAGLGLVMWTALSVFGGLASDELAFRLREAWDTAAYFYVGIPVMALAVSRCLPPAQASLALAALAGRGSSDRRAPRWPRYAIGPEPDLIDADPSRCS